jgi:hypothetical protein
VRLTGYMEHSSAEERKKFFSHKGKPIMPRPKCEYNINWHINETGHEIDGNDMEWVEFGLYWKQQDYFQFHKTVRYVTD